MANLKGDTMEGEPIHETFHSARVEHDNIWLGQTNIVEGFGKLLINAIEDKEVKGEDTGFGASIAIRIHTRQLDCHRYPRCFFHFHSNDKNFKLLPLSKGIMYLICMSLSFKK